MVFYNTKRNTLFITIFLLISITLWPCRIADLIISVAGIPDQIYRLFSAIPIFFCAIILHSKLDKNRKIILSFYILTILYLIFLELIKYHGTENSTLGQINRILLGCSYLIIFKSKKIDIHYFTRIFINVFFILSLLSCLQYFNIISPSLGDPRSPGGLLGLGGISGNVVNYYSSYSSYSRNTGFFSEPARFAQFLEFPLFFSILHWFRKKTIKRFIKSLVISIAFVTTFSVANFFGVFISLFIFFAIIYPRNKLVTHNHKHVRVYIIAILMTFLVTVGMAKFYEKSASLKYGEGYIGKDISATMLIRQNRFEIASSVLKNNFFGDRHFTKYFASNPWAIGIHIIQGGYILVFLVLAYSFMFYKYLFKHLKYSPNPLLYMSLIAFFIAFNWYGDYTEVFFLFLIAYTLRLIDEEKTNKKSIV